MIHSFSPKTGAAAPQGSLLPSIFLLSNDADISSLMLLTSNNTLFRIASDVNIEYVAVQRFNTRVETTYTLLASLAALAAAFTATGSRSSSKS